MKNINSKTESLKMLYKSLINIFVVAALSTGLAACSQDNEMTQAQNEAPVSSQNNEMMAETTNAPQTIEQSTVLVPQNVDGFTTAYEADNNMKEQTNVIANNEINSTLLFGFDSSALSTTGQEELLDLAQKMIAIQNEGDLNAVWQIVGHADAIGTDRYNERLAYRRAISVADYLIAQGVDETLLSVVSLGKSDVQSANQTEDYLDRRVEVHLFQEEVVSLAKQLQEMLEEAPMTVTSTFSSQI